MRVDIFAVFMPDSRLDIEADRAFRKFYETSNITTQRPKDWRPWQKQLHSKLPPSVLDSSNMEAIGKCSLCGGAREVTATGPAGSSFASRSHERFPCPLCTDGSEAALFGTDTFRHRSHRHNLSPGTEPGRDFECGVCGSPDATESIFSCVRDCGWSACAACMAKGAAAGEAVLAEGSKVAKAASHLKTIKSVKQYKAFVRRSKKEGRVAVVDFFAYWCGPCRRAAPHFEALVDGYGPQGCLFGIVQLGSTSGHFDHEDIRDLVAGGVHSVPRMVVYDHGEEVGGKFGSRAIHSGALQEFLFPRVIRCEGNARRASCKHVVDAVARVSATAAQLGRARRAEAARLEAERMKAVRLEAERFKAARLEAARIKAARLEAERAEAARLEAQRVKAARLEAQRFKAARLEAQRIKAARLEAERIKAARLEAERAEAAQLEADRAEAARLEAERIKAARLEAERAEAARLEAERAEAARLEAERIKAARLEAERAEAVLAQQQRGDAARKGEIDRVKAELALQKQLQPLASERKADAPMRRKTAMDLPPPRLSRKEAIKSVKDEMGVCNWALFYPKGSLYNAGSLGLHEMQGCVPEDMVLFGIVRMGFGSGRFRRVKQLFIHWIGWVRCLGAAHALAMPFTMSFATQRGAHACAWHRAAPWAPQGKCQAGEARCRECKEGHHVRTVGASGSELGVHVEKRLGGRVRSREAEKLPGRGSRGRPRRRAHGGRIRASVGAGGHPKCPLLSVTAHNGPLQQVVCVCVYTVVIVSTCSV